jgi:hypothetical protein
MTTQSDIDALKASSDQIKTAVDSLQKLAVVMQGQVAALQPSAPPVPTTSPDDTWITAAGQIIYDNHSPPWPWTLVQGASGFQVQANGITDGKTAGVVKLGWFGGKIHQENNWTPPGWWNSAPTNPPVWVQESDPTVGPPPPPPPGSATGFTVNQANGFRDNKGNKWELRGVNWWWGEFNQIKANVYRNFPGINFVRVVCGGDTTVDNIRSMVAELTGRQIICLIDYHSGVDGSTIGWYQNMCAAFKSNPYAFIETPNEPGGDVSGDQIRIINACRAAGWTNPIGLEIRGGWQLDNVGPTMASISQNNQIFLCPHNYNDWWNGNLQNGCNATGLYSVVDEFGDSTDGGTVDAKGADCVRHIIQSQQAHECGAAFWSATNGYHEGDNLFLDGNGNTLSSMGKLMQQMGWLA